MVNVAKYRNQTVSLQRKGATDVYGDITYGEPEQIKVRYSPDNGTVRTATGQEINAESVLLLDPADVVVLGDLIESSEVRRLKPIVDKRGKIPSVWCYL